MTHEDETFLVTFRRNSTGICTVQSEKKLSIMDSKTGGTFDFDIGQPHECALRSMGMFNVVHISVSLPGQLVTLSLDIGSHKDVILSLMGMMRKEPGATGEYEELINTLSEKAQFSAAQNRPVRIALSMQ